jgi:hypothetical protein
MEKPIVFLSHSSRDSQALNRLKVALEEKTHGTIDFFLSSDGESIPFGRNWVAAIQQALDRAHLCKAHRACMGLSLQSQPCRASFRGARSIEASELFGNVEVSQ